jgi:hypothetical protein
MTIDATVTAQSTTTWNHNNAGNMLVVAISLWSAGEANCSITNVTFNGDALTKAIESDGDGGVKQSIWYLANPDVGNYQIALTKSGTGAFSTTASSISFSGAKTTIGATAKNKGTSNAPSVVVAATNDSGYVVDAGYSNMGSVPPEAGANQTALHALYVGGNSRYSSYKAFAASGNVTMAWIASPSGFWVTCALEIGSDAAPAAAATPSNLLLMGVG